MKTIKLSAAVRPLAEYATELNDEILVLTERNKPVAAVVPLKHVDRESLALSTHPEFLGIIAQSRIDFARGRKLSLEQVKRAVLPRHSPHKRSGRARRTRHSTVGC